MGVDNARKRDHNHRVMPTPNNPTPRSGEAGALNRARFVELRDQGLSVRQIARRLDFSEQHVRRQLQRHDEAQGDQDTSRKSA